MLHKLAAKATAGIEKTRIRSSELKLGMYVAELDRPWIDSPFLVHGFVIRSQQQLEQVQALCRFVYVDIKRGNLAGAGGFQEKPEQTTLYQQTRSFEQNIDQAKIRYANAKSTVQAMFETFRKGEPFDVERLLPTIRMCVDNIIANPDSMLWLSMIKHKDEYTAEHSVNVALLSIVLGRAEGLDETALYTLGLCAMLHDVGKVKIPDDILNKEGNLNEEEFAVMKMHTVHGKKILMGQTGLPDIATEIALSHHEKMDGTGYPSGIGSAQIPYMVRIVSIVDAYDAMTSGRIYCEAKSPAEALRLLLKSKGQHHDQDLLSRFIDCIGVYPIGSVVEMNSGEIGIVMPGSGENNLQPEVMLVTDSSRSPGDARVIKTGRDRRPDGARPYMIRAIHEDGKYGIYFRQFSERALEFIRK